MRADRALIALYAIAVATACGAPAGEKKDAEPPRKSGWMACRDSPEKHPGPWRPIKDDAEQAKLRKELAGKGRIVFCSNRDGNWEIYVMKADGSGAERLTHDAGDDLAPAWWGPRPEPQPAPDPAREAKGQVTSVQGTQGFGYLRGSGPCAWLFASGVVAVIPNPQDGGA